VGVVNPEEHLSLQVLRSDAGTTGGTGAARQGEGKDGIKVQDQSNWETEGDDAQDKMHRYAICSNQMCNGPYARTSGAQGRDTNGRGVLLL